MMNCSPPVEVLAKGKPRDIVGIEQGGLFLEAWLRHAPRNEGYEYSIRRAISRIFLKSFPRRLCEECNDEAIHT
jgi:hypothetical protein